MGDFYCSPCGRYQPCDKCAPSPKQGIADLNRRMAALLETSVAPPCWRAEAKDIRRRDV